MYLATVRDADGKHVTEAKLWGHELDDYCRTWGRKGYVVEVEPW